MKSSHIYTLSLHDALPIWFDKPVTFPPGRAREATRPSRTGSPAVPKTIGMVDVACFAARTAAVPPVMRSEEHTSELQSLRHLVCRLLLEKKNKHYIIYNNS